MVAHCCYTIVPDGSSKVSVFCLLVCDAGLFCDFSATNDVD